MTQLTDPVYITTLLGGVRFFTSVYSFVVFFICFKNKKHIVLFNYLKNFVLSFAFWDLFRAIFYLYRGEELLPFLRSLVYLAFPFASVTFFHFCFAYCYPQYVSKNKWLRCIYIIPCISILCAIIPPLNGFFITFTAQKIYIPYRSTNEIHHVWYFVLIYYNLLCTLSGIILLGIKAKITKKRERMRCINLIIAAILFISLNVYRNIFTSNNGFWLSPIISTLSLTVLFFTVYYDETVVIISTGKNKLLETLQFPVFLLDKNGVLIYMNRAGSELWNTKIGFKKQNLTKKDIFHFFSICTTRKSPHLLQYENSIVVQHKINGQFFYYKEVSLKKDSKKSPQGKLLFFFAISSMKPTITSLQDMAYKDLLCDCYNRHYWDKQKYSIVHEYEFPICCFVCDIDNLKYVNDTYGHDIGDEYICFCYKEIEKTFANTDLIFRMGGDEFLIFVSGLSSQEAHTMYRSLKERISGRKTREGYQPNISIGYALLQDENDNLDEVISIADSAMYRDKELNKTLFLNTIN